MHLTRLLICDNKLASVNDKRTEIEYKRNQWFDKNKSSKEILLKQFSILEKNDFEALNYFFLNAAKIGDFDIVKKTLALGADIFAKANNGKNAIELIKTSVKEFRELHFSDDNVFLPEYRKY